MVALCPPKGDLVADRVDANFSPCERRWDCRVKGVGTAVEEAAGGRQTPERWLAHNFHTNTYRQIDLSTPKMVMVMVKI